jgi:hypothetical protein
MKSSFNEWQEPSLTPGLVHVEQELYKIEQPQWIFCLRRSREGGAMWSDGVRTIELEEFNIVYCINGRLEANDGKGGLYLVLI